MLNWNVDRNKQHLLFSVIILISLTKHFNLIMRDLISTELLKKEGTDLRKYTIALSISVTSEKATYHEMWETLTFYTSLCASKITPSEICALKWASVFA